MFKLEKDCNGDTNLNRTLLIKEVEKRMQSFSDIKRAKTF